MKHKAVLLTVIIVVSTAGAVFAQDNTTSTPDSGPHQNTLTTLAGEFFNNDFFDLRGHVAGTYDTNLLLSSTNGQAIPSWGVNVGGGVDLFHTFRTSTLSLDYNVSYRDYQTGGYQDGTTQNLAFSYSKRFNRHWSLVLDASGAEIRYGGAYYSLENTNNIAQTNPFSPVTRFLDGTASIIYQQTRRLSYTMSGSFFTNKYSSAYSFDSKGYFATGAVSYLITGRTSVSGTYDHSYFTYGRGAGQAITETVSGSVEHTFPGRWTASLSGGASRTNSTGTITIPVTFIFNGIPVTFYETGSYNTTSWTPTFRGTVTHRVRHFEFGATAGQGITPGNGLYLASRTLSATTTASYSVNRQANISTGFSYYHVSSLANKVSLNYENFTYSASFSYMVLRHLASDFRYNLLRYSNFGPFGARTDNRIEFGVTASLKGVPSTLF